MKANRAKGLQVKEEEDKPKEDSPMQSQDAEGQQMIPAKTKNQSTHGATLASSGPFAVTDSKELAYKATF